MTLPLQDLAARYRRTIASRYRALKGEELSEVPSGTTWLSPKIDGELWFAAFDGARAELIATGGRTLEHAPVVAELVTMATRVTGRTVLAGELFAASKGARPRVGDVAAALSEGGKALERLGWHAFDLLELNGEPAPPAYADRLVELARILDGGKRISAIKTVTTSDRTEIESLWREWGASGKAEGMIARSADGRIFKIKPGLTIDAAVVGYTKRSDAPDQVRSLVLALMRRDGSFQLIGSMGNLGGADARRALDAVLASLECASKFRHTVGDGSLVRWVEPKLVAEVACTDVQADDGEGLPVMRWSLRHVDTGWDPIGPMPSASLLHASLVRIRDDKRVSEVDVRLSQLSERCAIPSLEAAAVAPTLPRSVIVRRQVWTKEAKGKLAVRKLVVWQTNKERTTVGFPAWVVHFTDYSPDRKTPLERTVRTALSAAEANRVAEALIAENIKKGWEPVTDEPPAQAAAPSATNTPPAADQKAPSAEAESSEKPKKPRKTKEKPQA